MSMQRTPPTVSKGKLIHGQSLSESDLTVAPTYNISEPNITMRNKRQRPNDSPNKTTNPPTSPVLLDLKEELMEMLTKWKSEQEQLFTSWKNDQDKTLSKLISDVSELKQQCLVIQKTNLDIENSITFISEKYEDVSNRVSLLEEKKMKFAEDISHVQKQIEDLHFQTRQATIEIRNLPTKEKEKHEDLISVVKNVGKVMNMDIQSNELRDIYRIPGKPGICRPIVAEFTSVCKRNELLTNVRKYNKERSIENKLNTQVIGIPGERRSIYVDEHLPPATKKLLYETRQFAKAHNYASWYSNGRILLRQDPANKPIHIKSEKCLTLLLSQ